MAGMGSRFATAGYTLPKPLIPVHGVPMIRLVIENVRPSTPARFIFICQSTHVARHDLRHSLEAWAPGCVLIELGGVTQGAACTVLAAAEHIDNDASLIIANSDQYADVSIDDYLSDMTGRRLDGSIMTMTAHDPKWSFVGLDDDDLVTRVEEKMPISDHATVGIYAFRRGSSFVRAARSMIQKELRVNDEFYVAPVYNHLIEQGERVGIYDIGEVDDGMYGLGTPDDLQAFLARPISHRAAQIERWSS
jgi:dTDP-glucose pyrophosphorylase